MARPLRIEYEGAFYHIVQRGLERREIYKDEKDKERFLTYLSSAKEKYKSIIHSYALMDNHYHLILETPGSNLTKIMHFINASYASYYNARHKRVGPLYQGRYKSIIVQEEEYLKYLTSYIHLNPVRAKIVGDPGDYEWTSYKYFTRKEAVAEYLEVDLILLMFGDKREVARKKYKEYVLGMAGKEEEIIKNNVRKGLILGDEEFLNLIVEKYIDKEEDAEIPIIRVLKKQKEPGFEEIMKKVGDAITEDTRLMKRLAIYLTRKYTSKKLKEIGAFFGGIKDTAVSHAYKRVEAKRKGDKKLDKLIISIEKKL